MNGAAFQRDGNVVAQSNMTHSGIDAACVHIETDGQDRVKWPGLLDCRTVDMYIDRGTSQISGTDCDFRTLATADIF
jgi:hypothetical protein